MDEVNDEVLRTPEQPSHRSRARPRRAGVVGAVCVAIGLATAGVIAYATDQQATDSTSSIERAEVAPGVESTPLGRAEATPPPAGSEDPTSAAAGPEVDSVPALTPSLDDAPDDVADGYANDCHQGQRSPQVTSCVYGDEDSETVVALVGDSHAAHWQPTLRVLAEKDGFRLETYTKSSCLFGDVTLWENNTSTPYESCTAWQAEVVERLAAQQPDAVVVSSIGDYRLAAGGEPLSRAESFDAVAAGAARNWQALEGAGIEVLAIVDTPWRADDVPECIAQHMTDLSECNVPRDEAVAVSGAALQRAAAELAPAADLVDLTDFICPGEECAPVIDGVIVYRDAHHLTATYARSLAPHVAEALLPLLG